MITNFLSFPHVDALLGGVLIGLGATTLMLSLGRIAGISGMINLALIKLGAEHEQSWRRLWLIGLIAGGGSLHFLYPTSQEITAPMMNLNTLDWMILCIGGVFVGFGTVMGNGCTSGHGVCGIARGSKRSIAATLIFVITAIIVRLILKHSV